MWTPECCSPPDYNNVHEMTAFLNFSSTKSTIINYKDPTIAFCNYRESFCGLFFHNWMLQAWDYCLSWHSLMKLLHLCVLDKVKVAHQASLGIFSLLLAAQFLGIFMSKSHFTVCFCGQEPKKRPDLCCYWTFSLSACTMFQNTFFFFFFFW